MISVEVDAKATLADLKRLREDQLPFALSLALNLTGDEAQRVEQNRILREFTVRRKAFILNTVKRTHKPTKREPWYDLRIDPERDVLVKFEAGGFKTSIAGRPYVAVPTKAIRPTKTKVIPRHNRPAAFGPFTQHGKVAISPEGHLIVPTKRGNRILLQRLGSRKTLGKYAYRVVYVFVPRVRIPPDLKFYDTIKAAVESGWHANALKAIDFALRTARP